MDHSEVKHLPKVDHTPAEMDEASRVLLLAASLVEKHGLCKFVGADAQDRICALQAIGRAVTRLYGDREDYGIDIQKKANQRMEAVCGNPLFYWNDVPERTKAEVVSQLRAVALGL